MLGWVGGFAGDSQQCAGATVTEGTIPAAVTVLSNPQL